jgi:hypothetical protein
MNREKRVKREGQIFFDGNRWWAKVTHLTAE